MPTGLLSVLTPASQFTVTAERGATQSAKQVPSSSLAPRLDKLNGKTVYLVDTGFGGSYKFLDEIQGWFAEHMPSVKTVRRRKTGNIFRDDTKDLWTEIKDQGNAAILGVAG